MSSKKNDLSAFAGLVPQGVLKKAPKSKQEDAAPKPEKPKAKRKAPWERDDLDPNRIVNVSFRISEVEREMLKYIRAHSGASANHTLRSLVMPAVKKKAQALFREDDGE